MKNFQISTTNLLLTENLFLILNLLFITFTLDFIIEKQIIRPKVQKNSNQFHYFVIIFIFFIILQLLNPIIISQVILKNYFFLEDF